MHSMYSSLYLSHIDPLLCLGHDKVILEDTEIDNLNH